MIDTRVCHFFEIAMHNNLRNPAERATAAMQSLLRYASHGNWPISIQPID
jgi:hypothetical protein